MMQPSTASEHDPVALFVGEPGRAALEQLSLAYDLSDSEGWIGMMLDTLAEGGVVVVERSGDWVLFPAS